ncbi:hypothetical protein M0R45_011370 [Rubus argutus]|uniref:Uncharacterized protein n=1 Tax=Rubus argutus TaxID=59490 RepID=A0AAW1YB06_RUBAR
MDEFGVLTERFGLESLKGNRLQWPRREHRQQPLTPQRRRFPPPDLPAIPIPPTRLFSTIRAASSNRAPTKTRPVPGDSMTCSAAESLDPPQQQSQGSSFDLDSIFSAQTSSFNDGFDVFGSSGSVNSNVKDD